MSKVDGRQAFSQRGVRVSFGHPIADFGHPNIQILCMMQWDKKEFDTQFTPKPKIHTKALMGGGGGGGIVIPSGSFSEKVVAGSSAPSLFFFLLQYFWVNFPDTE